MALILEFYHNQDDFVMEVVLDLSSSSSSSGNICATIPLSESYGNTTLLPDLV